MDDIINIFTSISIDTSCTKSQVDHLIDKIANFNVYCPNTEWKSFQENYSKLKELRKINPNHSSANKNEESKIRCEHQYSNA